MSKPKWNPLTNQWEGPPPRPRGRPAGTILVKEHYRRAKAEVTEEPPAEVEDESKLPPSTLRWEARERLVCEQMSDRHEANARLRDLERIVLEHRRWLKQRREEDGVIYSLGTNGELQITMGEEWTEKICVAYDAGEIVEYPQGDPRAIYGFNGSDKCFGWKDGRCAIQKGEEYELGLATKSVSGVGGVATEPKDETTQAAAPVEGRKLG